MEIISTIKLQKIKKSAEHLREYMVTFLWMLSSIDVYVSLFPTTKSNIAKKELAVLVSSEKGLCGSLNTVLFKQFAAQYEDKKQSVEVYVVGKKAKEYCLRRGYVVVWSLSLTDIFSSEDIHDLYFTIDTARKKNQYTTMTVRYNYFKNTMKQIPVGFQLFPLAKTAFEEFLTVLHISLPKIESKKSYNSTCMELEPSKEVVVAKAYQILMNIIVYGAILHNKTGEFASRMLAMKGAKDNATTIVSDLTLAFNKARQDAITKEVLEIVSAKAVIED